MDYKLDGMINLKQKKCECGKHQAKFNYVSEIPRFCKDCKKKNMVDVTRKRKRDMMDEKVLVEYNPKLFEEIFNEIETF